METFRDLPILGILRCDKDAPVEDLISAVGGAGLTKLEIAMNSGDAPNLIRRSVRASGHRLSIGAGTVLDMQTLRNALDAGAGFIVMPALVEDVVSFCVKNKIPVFPGAFSPQEIYRAWNAGATMVKVFPIAMFGPSYIREVKAPFNNIELLACGGLTPENIRSYFDNGASAVAFGSSIFRKEWLDNRDFTSIEKAVRQLLNAYATIREKL